MTEYPLDKPARSSESIAERDRQVRAEAEAALRSSFEIHGKSSIYAANEDLTLNPVPGSSRNRPLTSDLYARSPSFRNRVEVGEEESEDTFADSAIDDVVSSGTWHTSSYLGPKRTALEDPATEALDDSPIKRASAPREPGRDMTGSLPRETSSRPYMIALGAAGAGFFLARMMTAHRSS